MKIPRCLLLAALLAVSGVSEATTISLVPSSPTAVVGSTVTAQLQITDILPGTPSGLAFIHADLFYDTSVLSLVSATAGDFFDNNFAGGAGSVWVDALNPGPILSPDPVATFATNPTTLPDVLGFDFLETNFVGSLTDGILVNLEFTALGAGNALFSLNDIEVFDNFFFPVMVDQSVGSLTVTAVPEPATLLLLLAAGGLGAAFRRRRSGGGG